MYSDHANGDRRRDLLSDIQAVAVDGTRITPCAVGVTIVGKRGKGRFVGWATPQRASGRGTRLPSRPSCSRVASSAAGPTSSFAARGERRLIGGAFAAPRIQASGSSCSWTSRGECLHRAGAVGRDPSVGMFAALCCRGHESGLSRDARGRARIATMRCGGAMWRRYWPVVRRDT